jgi:hypothetical protein
MKVYDFQNLEMIFELSHLSSSKNLVVLAMRTNPKPDHARLIIQTKRTVMQTNTHKPKLTNLFEF